MVTGARTFSIEETLLEPPAINPPPTRDALFVFLIALTALLPVPVFSALVAGAIFCGVCGYQRRLFRRFWFLGFWICAALACLTKGLHGLICPAAVFLLLALLYREARLRFRLLLHWSYLSIFLLMVAPWYIWAEWHFPGFFRRLVGVEWLGHLHAAPNVPGSDNGVPRLQFIALHFAWWFPWSIVLF